MTWRVADISSSRPLPGGLLRRWEADEGSAVLPRSDGAGEFGEDRCEPMPSVNIDAEFVVAAADVLDERVPGTDHLSAAEGPVASVEDKIQAG